MARKLTEAEVKAKLAELMTKLKYEKNKNERDKIHSLLNYYRHYEIRCIQQKIYHAKRKELNQIVKRIPSALEWELIDYKNRTNPVEFKENEKTKKDIQNKIIQKCDKCKKEITTDYSYTTLRLLEKNIRYCEKCKTKEMIKIFI